MSDRFFSWPELGNPPSKAFERFRTSVEAPVQGRDRLDSFDLDALRALEGDERSAALDMLIDLIGREADGRVADALAVTRSPQAIEPLERALERLEPGVSRNAVARALAELKGQGGQAEADAVIETLRQGSWSQRANAANALRRFHGPAVSAALWNALSDDHKLVRIAAVNSLYELAGLSDWAESSATALGMLRVRIGCEIAAVRRQARSELRDVLDQIAAGKTPVALGLHARVDLESEPIRRFRDSRKAGDESDIDIAALAGADESVRRWAMHTLITARTLDARAVRALAELGDATAIEPLDEIKAGAGSQLGLEIDTAKARIRQRTGGQ